MKWPLYLERNWGQDAGHPWMSTLTGMAVFALGGGVLWSGLAAQLYPIPKELRDIKRQKWAIKVDNVSDLLSYQLVWPVLFAADLNPLMAAVSLVVIAVAYLILVYVKTEGEM